MSSDDAAWRELIAQYEQPVSPDAAEVPWPDRENLHSPPGHPTGQHGGQSATADPVFPITESPDRDVAADASASTADPPGAGDAGASAADAGASAADPPGAGDDPADHRAPDGIDRTRVVRHANPVWRPATDAPADEEDDDDRYIPPPPPPLPRLDAVAKGAWVALIGGPLYLLLATLLSWQVSGFTALLAVAAFVGGFVVLIFRMGDGPSRGDGPDNGAVV